MNTRILLACALAATFALAACSKPPETSTGSPAAAVVSDSEVTRNVKTALQGDSTVKGLDISVTTLKGDVKLSGMADTQAQVDQALTVARAVAGVNTIQDELKLRK